MTLLLSALVCCGSLLALSAAESAAEPKPADTIPAEGGAISIYPINHATFALEFKGAWIYIDPVGGKKAFNGLPEPGLILLTDIHGDHLNAETLTAVAGQRTVVVAPPAAVSQIPAPLRERTTVLKNDASHEWSAIRIRAIPAYNLTPDRLKFHEKGRGNGYLLELGGKRVYISGDTEPTPEMLSLKNIDAAFLCMNLPYTMDVDQAAQAVKAFKPRIVYPYHSRGSDLEKFKSLVGSADGVQVRILSWYPGRP